MNKKCMVLVVTFLLMIGGFTGFVEAADFSSLNITVGNVRIPRAFIHAGKNYDKGTYYVTLTAKEGIPYFNVHNRNKELLFEEMAVLKLKDYKGTAKKLRYRVKKEMLRDYEYFRILVNRPDASIIAYLLIQQKAQPKQAQKPTPKKQVAEIQ